MVGTILELKAVGIVKSVDDAMLVGYEEQGGVMLQFGQDKM